MASTKFYVLPKFSSDPEIGFEARLFITDSVDLALQMSDYYFCFSHCLSTVIYRSENGNLVKVHTNEKTSKI